MARKKKGYVSISIPIQLIEEVEYIIKNKKYGYKTITEFIREATRLHLREVNSYLREREKEVLKNI